MSADTPVLDLHGMRMHEAEVEIDRFLDRHFRAGDRVVKIMHGKGTERLAHVIPNFVKKHPLTEYVGEPNGTFETGAVIYVIIDV